MSKHKKRCADCIHCENCKIYKKGISTIVGRKHSYFNDQDANICPGYDPKQNYIKKEDLTMNEIKKNELNENELNDAQNNAVESEIKTDAYENDDFANAVENEKKNVTFKQLTNDAIATLQDADSQLCITYLWLVNKGELPQELKLPTCYKDDVEACFILAGHVKLISSLIAQELGTSDNY